MDTFIKSFEWRAAIKKFDVEKQVSSIDLNKILSAIRLAPSAFGIQAFHVFIVKDKKIRKRLKLKSYLQSQVVDASCLLVFCARTDIGSLIDEYFDIASKDSKQNKLKLLPRKLAVLASLKKMNSQELLEWSRQQAYIALGFGLAACAELQIDSCPMSGFVTSGVDKVLELPANMKSTVYLAIGYRAKGDLRDKVRFPLEDLFTHK
jgi:nitroreductase